MEEQLIFEIWDTFRDHIPEKGRDTAAAQFVDFLVNKDVDAEALEGINIDALIVGGHIEAVSTKAPKTDFKESDK
jgi:hypothetical protein